MFVSLGLALLSLTACVEDVAKDKVEAVVEEVAPAPEPVAEAPAPPPAAEGDAWSVDATQSSIRALGAKITATHPIDFKEFDAKVKVADGQVVGLDYTVQMAKLESDHPKLTQHLLNADFFDVEKHPTSTFVSTSVTEGSDVEGMTHTVSGNMTIMGKEMKVTFPAKIKVDGDMAKAKTEFALDRKDFGIVYPGKPDDLIQDKVVLTVELVAKKG